MAIDSKHCAYIKCNHMCLNLMLAYFSVILTFAQLEFNNK